MPPKLRRLSPGAATERVMARVHDLLGKIADAGLRDALSAEVKKLEKGKKFGLVFEEHLPEAAPMPGIPIRGGMTVATRAQDGGALYFVKEVVGKVAKCVDEATGIEVEFALDDLVAVTKFGEPIYPYLQKVDEIEHGGGDLWHTLIQADNYHALQLVEYLYAGKVDCIYIDPPYNTGAKDWKYNNDYVDGNDAWRHSKWLSMMEKRLKIAKRLLNPKDSVLIVTIDEKEYLHLGMLLEQMFPEARIQMVSSVINPKGVSALHAFRRADEYLFYVMLGNAGPAELPLSNEWSPSSIKARQKDAEGCSESEPGWTSMMRRGSHSSRSERPGLYYAIYADPKSKLIKKVGEALPPGVHSDTDVEGLVQILPLRSNGDEGCWQVGPAELRNRISQGRVRLGKETDYGYVVNYLSDGEYKKIVEGYYIETGKDADGSIIAKHVGGIEKWVAPTQWKISSHDASAYGSTFLLDILQRKVVIYPKSLYAVHDAIRFFVANKPNALVLDFFAGSGTTLHAVNLLNAEDGGKRRCILVTNNEVSEDEAKAFRKQGLKPGDAEWEAKGIAQYVTWPRTVCSIKGVDVKGAPLKGEYLTAKGGGAPGGRPLPDGKMLMADGFQANAAFFKLGFLEPTPVGLGRRFEELLPVLWMKAGAVGRCPTKVEGGRWKVDGFSVFAENRFAVLFDESAFAAFKKEVRAAKTIETIYVVTDFDPSYRAMAKAFPGKAVFPLYRDYLDSFRINASRS